MTCFTTDFHVLFVLFCFCFCFGICCFALVALCLRLYKSMLLIAYYMHYITHLLFIHLNEYLLSIWPYNIQSLHSVWGRYWWLLYRTDDRDVFHYLAMYFSFWHPLSSFCIHWWSGHHPYWHVPLVSGFSMKKAIVQLHNWMFHSYHLLHYLSQLKFTHMMVLPNKWHDGFVMAHSHGSLCCHG